VEEARAPSRMGRRHHQLVWAFINFCASSSFTHDAGLVPLNDHSHFPPYSDQQRGRQSGPRPRATLMQCSGPHAAYYY
jgi:hypothetical protein